MLSMTLQQIALLVMPPVLLATTYVAYRGFAGWLGPERGYLAGFLFYWLIWCFLLPASTIGFEGFRRMFGELRLDFGRPGWLGALLMLTPVLVAFVTMFPGYLKEANLTAIGIIALFSLANGTMEEVLWRGAYQAAFPDSWLWGLIYPSTWFGLWHLAPQVVYPAEATSPFLFALMPIFLGLAFGWVVWQTGSIWWVVLSHILLDFAGAGSSNWTLGVIQLLSESH